MKKPELLVPAGNLEILKTAVMYGADAVYIGGELYGLRAKAKNFGPDQMKEGIDFAHEHGVKVYVTANITAHNRDIAGIREYFTELKQIRPDALIISDPGVFTIAREICPEIDIHVSTQANNVNYETYNFWYKLGAKRVVSARELSLAETKEIRNHIPDDLEIESFVHGAMCISYSGRCLLSSFMTGRDANLGACTHPCRWKYSLEGKNPVTGELEDFTLSSSSQRDEQEEIEDFNYSPDKFFLEEEKRRGEFFPVAENERGTYIFNSKDLCMIEHIPELIDAGINSFKIEGRMKPALYVAVVASVYREAIDDYLTDPMLYNSKLPAYREAISKCSHRRFYTGFYFGRPNEDGQLYSGNVTEKDAVYLGFVESVDGNGYVCMTQKNKFNVGEKLDVMRPHTESFEVIVEDMLDENGEHIDSCPHAEQKIRVRFSRQLEEWDIVRRVE